MRETGISLDNAWANLAELLREAGREDLAFVWTGRDDEGRYVFDVEVLGEMIVPGHDLERLKSPKRLDAGHVFIDGGWYWWAIAVRIARGDFD